MDVGHQVIGERAGTRSGAWAGLRQLPGLWRVFLFSELAWLIISVVVLRFTVAGANNAAVLGAFVAAALAISILARDAGHRTRQAARAGAECELLATAAASVLHGPEALTAVLDQDLRRGPPRWTSRPTCPRS